MTSPATADTATVACEHCGRRNRVPAAASGVPRCGNCHQPLPWIVEAGDQNFAETAEQSDVPVLVDMWAPWCAPCKTVSPALETMAREYAERLKLVKVNVDRAPQLARRFSIQAVPTLLLLQRGQILARQSGAAPVEALRRWIEQSLPGAERGST